MASIHRREDSLHCAAACDNEVRGNAYSNLFVNPEKNIGFPNLSRAWRTTLAIATVALAACAPLDRTAVRSESTPRIIASKAIGSPSFAFGSGGDLQLLVAVARRRK